MKIALYMDPPYIGGAERHFVDLCRGLIATDEAGVEIVCPAGPLPPYVHQRLGEAAPVHVLSPRPGFGDSFAANLIRSRRAFGELRATFSRIDPDVIHIHNGGYPASHLARVAIFSHRAPRVMTVNNRARERSGIRRIYKPIDRSVWRALSCVITPSDATAQRLVEVRDCPPGMIEVIPYGIEPAQATEDEVARARQEIGGEASLLVGMIAAPGTEDHVAHKGHRVLLEALGRVRESDVRVAIIGHDPGTAFRDRANELGVADKLQLLPGFRNAAPYMHAVDAVVVPSTRNEALPLVILEAMSAGTAVLASRLSGIPEAIDDGRQGYLFEAGDSEALAGLIGRLAADPQQAEALGRAARRRFEERFTVEPMVSDTLNVYRRAA